MFGYEFVWAAWVLINYNATKFDGPGRWVFFQTVYWEMHDGKKIYYLGDSSPNQEAE